MFLLGSCHLSDFSKELEFFSLNRQNQTKMDTEFLLLAAATFINIIVVRHYIRKRNVTKKRIIRKPWLKRRSEKGLGILKMLNEELATEDTDSYKNFLRVSEEQFNHLLFLVKNDIEKEPSVMQETISASSRLQITLRFLATGESFRSLMYATRVHESSISRFIPVVCEALYRRLKSDYLKTPNSVQKWMGVAQEFYDLWQFPHCLGALDGKHVSFRPPRSDGSYYFNYKGTHSIVLLGIADANYKFIYVNVGCNGRISDGGVFRESTFASTLTKNTLNFPPAEKLPGRDMPVPYVIVADDAFPHKDVIIKPYPQRGLSHSQRIFNYRLSRARRVIENAFGILANRFRVLLDPINLRASKVETITLACVVLHNYLATENGSSYTDISTINTPPRHMRSVGRQCGNKSMDAARNIRDEFRAYFCSDAGAVSWQEQAIKNFNM